MFGLTPDKILIIVIVAALLLGPHRLPGLARGLADAVRRLRRFLTDRQADLGVDAGEISRQVRAYDPRRIVREAWDAAGEPAGADAQAPDAAEAQPDTAAGGGPADGDGAAAGTAEVEYREKWILVGGSSGHPQRRKVRVPVEPGGGPADSPADTGDSSPVATAAHDRAETPIMAP